jgi:hypothetical protein
MDPRIKRAQELYWRTYGPGHTPQTAHWSDLVEMAGLHEAIARDRLGQGDALGWIDLYAAVTVWGDAGRLQHGHSLICWGRERAPEFASMEDDILRELSELERWLEQKHVFIEVPEVIRRSLADRDVDRLALIG